MRHSHFAILLALLLSIPGGAVAASSREGCTKDWSVASRIVTEQNLTTVEQLAAAAKHALGGSIVRSALCREKNGKYTYQLLIRKRSGALKRTKIDARRPFR
ncbi:MAG: PepSY domain-containing protein [Hyphomicrobiaceae bacterium]